MRRHEQKHYRNKGHFVQSEIKASLTNVVMDRKKELNGGIENQSYRFKSSSTLPSPALAPVLAFKDKIRYLLFTCSLPSIRT